VWSIANLSLILGDGSSIGLSIWGNRELNPAHITCPLVIGITGHPDIRNKDREDLLDAVTRILLELKGKYSATPLILLSSLAEGADRLAAQAGLLRDVHCRLFVTLPIPLTLYEQGFVEDSLTDFRNLLDLADGSLELPRVVQNHEGRLSAPERELQYQSLGKYIVEKSQLLIALWDGVDSNLVGSPASTVRLQRQGISLSDSLDASEGFPVYHVLTPHTSNLETTGEPFDCQMLYPDSFGGSAEKARKYYDRMFSRIDKFNHYVVHANRKLKTEVFKSKNYLLPDLYRSKLPSEIQSELERYGFADALAIRFQNAKTLTKRLLHGAIFLAFISFVLFAHGGQNPMFLLCSFVLLGLGSLWSAVFRSLDGDTKPEDYRAMAEGLRVRLFWRLAGLSDSVTAIYLGKQRTELDWIRNGFRGWDIPPTANVSVAATDLLERLHLVRTNWVENQVKYFEGASKREEHRYRRIEVGTTVLAGLAVVLGIVLFGFLLNSSGWKIDLAHAANQERIDWALIFIEAALAGAALLHNYGSGMAYREHAKQYTRMGIVFSRAAEILNRTLAASDYKTALRCVRHLGKEALTENGDWVLLHRERPLEMPHP
jgi:hypothetical protein